MSTHKKRNRGRDKPRNAPAQKTAPKPGGAAEHVKPAWLAELVATGQPEPKESATKAVAVRSQSAGERKPSDASEPAMLDGAACDPGRPADGMDVARDAVAAADCGPRPPEAPETIAAPDNSDMTDAPLATCAAEGPDAELPPGAFASPPAADPPVPLERTWTVTVNKQARPPPGRRHGGRTAGGAAGRTASSASSASSAKPPEASMPSVGLVGQFASVQRFWQYYNNLPRPSTLRPDCDMHIFQEGVEPVWEHPANQRGGRWVLTCPRLSDESWMELCMALVGETLDVGLDAVREAEGAADPKFEVVGVVLSCRPDYQRVSIWTRNRDSRDALLVIGSRFKALLGAAKVDYQDHDAAYGSGYRYTL